MGEWGGCLGGVVVAGGLGLIFKEGYFRLLTYQTNLMWVWGEFMWVQGEMNHEVINKPNPYTNLAQPK